MPENDEDTNCERRAFLRKTAATAVGTSGLTAFAGRASANHVEEKPEYVSISYDESFLKRHQPKLTMSRNTENKLISQYGLKATSPEYDTDVAVYWNSYTHQDGVSSYDSHYGDHEPLYVFVNEDGSIEQIIYAAYHWFAGRTVSPLTDDGHPLFHVFEPHHHYSTTSEIGQLISLNPLATAESIATAEQSAFESWLVNGLEESLAVGTVLEPWIMQNREHWWKKGTLGVSSTALYVSIRFILGLDGASKSDIS